MVDPKGLTGILGDDPEIGRLLGARDAVVGLALLGIKGPAPLVLRLASDIHDAVRLRERSTTVALGAAAVALWGAAAVAGAMSESEAWPEDDRHRVRAEDRRARPHEYRA
jgi:hypothetical protein